MATSSPGAAPASAFEREERWRAYLREIGQGNTQALARFYDELSPMLYALSLRVLRDHADAEEVLLDVFAQVWRKAASFDPARGTVWTWVVLLTRSRAVDRLRAETGRRQREQPATEDHSDITSQEPLPDEATIFRQQQVMVRRALLDLPAEQRRAIELACFSGLTHAEIAARVGAPLGTIKTRIRAGMQTLRATFLQASPATGDLVP